MQAKVLKRMVGPCGLEPQTSTVSKLRHYVLPITYNTLGTALERASTAKTKDLQVKLQVRNFRADEAMWGHRTRSRQSKAFALIGTSLGVPPDTVSKMSLLIVDPSAIEPDSRLTPTLGLRRLNQKL